MANSSSCSSSANEILPDTSSTCLTQSITTTHDFMVTNFSLLKGMGVGKFVSSSTFTADGCDWNINLYPDGEKTGDHVSVFLRLLRGSEDTRAKFSLSLLFGNDDDQGSRKKGKQKKNGKGIKVTRECHEHTFGFESSPNWGWVKFVKKSQLRELLLGSNDCFTIRCVLTVLTVRIQDASTIVVPPSDLHQDFAKMLTDADGADVTINVGDRFFLAHRYVLAARCRVFKAQLFGVMKESNTECLRIEDMEPSVFERLLHFIYTDSLSENYEGDKCVAMLHLLIAADRYGLQRLSLICEEKLRNWIDVQSAATILGLADQHHRVQLKKACLGFIAWPDVLGAVMETESFEDLIASNPMIMKEILKKIASAKHD
ncbi:unnamed protein product [Urochloa decumbens]|uniref:Uncharacterized protein n=1 Tax=Urochloa decumbens TaxID=240449 RepID=A0ABC9F8B4_9POAL